MAPTAVHFKSFDFVVVVICLLLPPFGVGGFMFILRFLIHFFVFLCSLKPFR